MYEFLNMEFELCGEDKTVHLGGLLAEMIPEADGSTGDPGAAQQFVDSIQRVLNNLVGSKWQY